MKQNHLLSLLQKNFITIHVAFRSDIDAANGTPQPVAFDTSRSKRKPDPRTHTYKCPQDENVKVDDFVVVDGPKGGPMVGLVIRVDDFADINPDADFEYKWIVQRINREPYEARLKSEAEFLETMKHVEREAQRAELVEKFAAHLPVGSEARNKFDLAVSAVSGAAQLTNGDAK